jgi:hypothetical protein
LEEAPAGQDDELERMGRRRPPRASKVPAGELAGAVLEVDEGSRGGEAEERGKNKKKWWDPRKKGDLEGL